jgi:hypothetical protein
VSLQIGLQLERLQAEFAFVRLSALMGYFMALEVMQTLKPLATNVALIAIRVFSMGSNVLLIGLHTEELSVTVFALELVFHFNLNILLISYRTVYCF